MKVQCSKCQSTYKIDEDKIPDSGAKFKCTQCENIFEVTKPESKPSFFTPEASTENTKPERTLNVNTCTSITDKPIKSMDENLLGIENYATALSEFVLESATPLTIGMQGEWGTGKTSLMYLVREKLDNTKDDNKVATSWVNTWEYSLFREPFQITPSVLKGLLENLEQTCRNLGYWGADQNWDKAKSFFKKGAKVVGTFAVKTAVKKTTGQDVDLNSQEPLTVEIAEIKNEIQKNINMIINDDKNPLKKIVFFVDDLDRIDPPVAVEVLEALKNIFDLENCVFILAIDYDVVIKGLEKKFGKKTDINEREFRSFFDKIIQVPFSMPTGAYEIDNLLESKLNDLGLSLDEDLKEDFVRILQMTVGYIPRSIKRYVNSFSLLKKIRSMDPTENHDKLADFCLFTLLGIQISYPKIYRLIAKKQDFTKWNGFFGKQIGVDEILIPGEKNEYTDEEWEQLLWSYCQMDPYLKARSLSIIGALNLLREKLGKNLIEIMEQSMEFTSMTSVDDDVETKHAGRGRRDTNRYFVTDPDGVEHIVDDLGKFVEDVNKVKGKNFIWAGNLRKVAQGKTKKDNSKGYKCRYADENVKIAA